MARSGTTLMSSMSSSGSCVLLVIILVTVLVVVLNNGDSTTQPPQSPQQPQIVCPSLSALPSSFGAVAKGDVGTMSYDNLISGEQHIFPDGLVSCVKSRKQPGTYVAIWSEAMNYRSQANTSRLEQHKVTPPIVYGYTFCKGQSTPYYKDWASGGQWLLWVSPLPNNPDRWLGLIHTEAGVNSAGECIGGGQPAFKTIAITYSNDEGKTWESPSQIIKVGNSAPNSWGGAGDMCGIYVCQTKTWYCYFGGSQGGMGIARSMDPEAKAGTWQVLLNNGWVDALNTSAYSPLRITYPNAANPNVFFSTHYNAYVMILWPYESGNLTMSLSQNGLDWSPFVNVSVEGEGLSIPPTNGHPLFPFVIGSNGHLEVGKTGVLYYAVWDDKSWRHMKYRTIEFR